MDNKSTKTENFVTTYLKRALAFKALRQLRVEVDKIDAEEVSKKKWIKIIAVVFVLISCLVLLIAFTSCSEKKSLTVIDKMGRASSQIEN